MKLWKTLAICSATTALLGLAAAPPAMAIESVPSAATLAPTSVVGLTTPGAHGAGPISIPGYSLVQVATGIAHSVVDATATPAPSRTLRFSNANAPQAVTVEVSYRQSDGGLHTQVSPLLPAGGPGWTAPLPGDARDVDIQVRSASGVVLGEMGYPGEMPDGNPTIYWEYRSYFNLPGYTFVW